MADKLGRSRTRNFATVVYPESAPENWKELLVQQFVPAMVSPLHDKDINPTGELKKPHYHVIIQFDSVKTADQAKEVFEVIGGVGCEPVKSIRAYTRYLCHLDNPDKAQYSVDDVLQFGGADFYKIIECVIDRYTAIAEILDFCDDNQIYSFRKLVQICRQEHFEWFRSICDGGIYVIKEYLKSANWEDRSK
ncbi:replication protein [bacterium]|nr:replication protein [bacterium]